MEKYNGKPVFDIIVDYDDETGMLRNSWVDRPAVGVQKLAFNETQKMFFADKNRRNYFMSVSILSDTPILRRAENGEEFYVKFSKETIRTIVNKLVMNGLQNEVTLQHDDTKKLEGVYLVEQFFSEKDRVYSPKFDVPEGSLIQTYWVKSDEQYEALLNDEKFNGFSIELGANLEAAFSDAILESRIKEIVFDETISDDEKEASIKKLLNL